MNTTAQPLPTTLPGMRALSPQEEVQRQSAAACVASPTPDCQKVINVGIFFDGTNNNLERDEKESPKSHTNIAVLYKAYRDDPDKGSYAVYVPGIGTAFPQIGEPTESDKGKAFGLGGDQRINWALIQVVNAIHRAVYGDKPLLSDEEAGLDACTWPLHGFDITGNGLTGKRKYFRNGVKDGDNEGKDKDFLLGSRERHVSGQQAYVQSQVKRINAEKQVVGANHAALDVQLARLKAQASSLSHQSSTFRDSRRRAYTLMPLLERLGLALQRKVLPKVTLVNLSVFGFSRGAAQARAFCHMLRRMLTHDGTGLIAKARDKTNPSYSLAGIPLRLQFLGLLDTVASVGMPAPSGIWKGFGGWANGTMDIADCVERCVHFVAAHEVRGAFPASSGRIGDKYPDNCLEMVYPGTHSDVGGGYPAGSQGKAMFDRTRLLSQVPLVNMYTEAIKSGVPLRSQDELAKSAASRELLADLQIHPDTQRLFQRYAEAATGKPERVEELLKRHMRLYWRWRRQHAQDYPQVAAKPQKSSEKVYVSKLSSVRNASSQHQQDLMESEHDFKNDGQEIEKFVVYSKGNKYLSPPATDYHSDLALGGVDADVDNFFDTLVHDSHATFYMCGPTTALDKANWYQTVKKKSDDGEKLGALEARVLAGKGVEFPLLSDADTPQLLEFFASSEREALKLTGQTTRRGKNGHVRYRQIFDHS